MVEQVLKKLMRQEELYAILPTGQVEKEGIPIGEVRVYELGFIVSCFHIYVPRVDKLIAFDRELNNGGLSTLGYQALAIRGFTFPEFQDLFSAHISEEEYCFYPIFGQLIRRGKRGIYTAKHRDEFTSKYSNDEEGYLKALYENGCQPHCGFFLSG